MGNANPFKGLAELIVGDFLSDTSLTGYSTKAWYLLRAPSFCPAMLVAALNGKVEPQVDTAEADFNTLGIQMRGYNDVGFARGETLCGIRSKGEA